MVFALFMSVTIIYTLRYANKVKKNSALSLVKDCTYDDFKLDSDKSDTIPFTWRHKLQFLAFLGGIAAIVYGGINHGWYLTEISAFFLIDMILCGFIAGYGPSKIAVLFVPKRERADGRKH